MADWAFLILPLFVVAVLYGAVGHGGASGYLAVMALAGIAPAVIKPTALTLNLAVSLIGTVLFFRAGHFAWRLFWPFAVTSIPFAFLGGRLDLPTHVLSSSWLSPWVLPPCACFCPRQNPPTSVPPLSPGS